MKINNLIEFKWLTYANELTPWEIEIFAKISTNPIYIIRNSRTMLIYVSNRITSSLLEMLIAFQSLF